VNVGGANEGLSGLSQILLPPRWETRVETLRRDPSAEERISPDESVVSVGDQVETADEADLDAAATTAWR
jgi:hypothetical protein